MERKTLKVMVLLRLARMHAFIALSLTLASAFNASYDTINLSPLCHLIGDNAHYRWVPESAWILCPHCFRGTNFASILRNRQGTHGLTVLSTPHELASSMLDSQVAYPPQARQTLGNFLLCGLALATQHQSRSKQQVSHIVSDISSTMILRPTPSIVDL